MSGVAVFVTWSMRLPYNDPVSWIAQQHKTTLPAWASLALNGGIAAQRIVEEFFNEDSKHWREWFGDDEDLAGVFLEIHAPPAFAGWYSVSLLRRIRARATRMEDL